MKMHKSIAVIFLIALLFGGFAAAAHPGDGVVQPLQTLKAERLPTDLDRGDLIAVSPWMYAGFQNLAEVLVGRIPGVQVTGNFQYYRIRIRGSLRPPLIVLDNQPFYGYDDSMVNSLLQSIPVVDVASIEVIKGLGRAGIFGPGAGNGVILIKTRSGDEGIQ